jgi:hypothetical protein
LTVQLKIIEKCVSKIAKNSYENYPIQNNEKNIGTLNQANKNKNLPKSMLSTSKGKGAETYKIYNSEKYKIYI